MGYDIEEKHYINKNTKYTFVLRKGKDCYRWFEIADYWGNVEFISAKHKISLNAYRIFKFKAKLINNGIYI